MKYITLALGILMILIGWRACTYTPIHLTSHTISNGEQFTCIYETKDDFEQAQMDGIFRGDMFYVNEDGTKEVLSK